MTSLHARVIERASEKIGSRQALCDYLQVPLGTLQAWLAEGRTLPDGVFLRALQLISARSWDVHDSVLERARRALFDADILRAGVVFLRERRQRVTMSAASHAAPAVRAPRRRPVEFLATSFEAENRQAIARAALDAALCATGADMGNVQLPDATGLRIVAQRGFEQPFLEFFSCVRDNQSACGLAMQRGERVIVADVATDPMFARTDAGEVLRQAQVGAVQSTPLFGSSGQLLGVLSTHYEKAYYPSGLELAMLNPVVQHAARWLDRACA